MPWLIERLEEARERKTGYWLGLEKNNNKLNPHMAPTRAALILEHWVLWGEENRRTRRKKTFKARTDNSQSQPTYGTDQGRIDGKLSGYYCAKKYLKLPYVSRLLPLHQWIKTLHVNWARDITFKSILKFWIWSYLRVQTRKKVRVCTHSNWTDFGSL